MQSTETAIKPVATARAAIFSSKDFIFIRGGPNPTKSRAAVHLSAWRGSVMAVARHQLPHNLARAQGV